MVKRRPGLRTKITGIGFDSGDRALKLMISDLTQEQVKVLYPKLEMARDRMIQRALPFTTNTDESIISNFIITPASKGNITKNTTQIKLQNVSPHSAAIEGGVREHYIYRVQPGVEEWMESHGIVDIRGNTPWRITVGKPSGYIEKRKSQRAFFEPILSEMIEAGEFKEAYRLGLINTFRNFKTRAGKRDKKIIRG